jgi:hypothetical protein
MKTSWRVSANSAAMIDSNSQIYVDANVFIYFVEGSAEFEERTKRFFLLAADRRASLSTSELTSAYSARIGSEAVRWPRPISISSTTTSWFVFCPSIGRFLNQPPP